LTRPTATHCSLRFEADLTNLLPASILKCSDSQGTLPGKGIGRWNLLWLRRFVGRRTGVRAILPVWRANPSVSARWSVRSMGACCSSSRSASRRCSARIECNSATAPCAPARHGKNSTTGIGSENGRRRIGECRVSEEGKRLWTSTFDLQHSVLDILPCPMPPTPLPPYLLPLAPPPFHPIPHHG